jgi:hypothetical protein
VLVWEKSTQHRSGQTAGRAAGTEGPEQRRKSPAKNGRRRNARGEAPSTGGGFRRDLRDRRGRYCRHYRRRRRLSGKLLRQMNGQTIHDLASANGPLRRLMQAAFYTDFLLMDVRREPRFSIYGPIKVTLLSSPERELEAVLLDISATGLKLIAPESLAVDEIVSIAAEDHLALADVRYSQPRGDKFTIGCERIHLLNKVSLPNEKSKIEQIRLLIEDYRNRIRTGIATERPDTNQVEAARLDVFPPPEKPRQRSRLCPTPAHSPLASSCWTPRPSGSSSTGKNPGLLATGARAACQSPSLTAH